MGYRSALALTLDKVADSYVYPRQRGTGFSKAFKSAAEYLERCLEDSTGHEYLRRVCPDYVEMWDIDQLSFSVRGNVNGMHSPR